MLSWHGLLDDGLANFRLMAFLRRPCERLRLTAFLTAACGRDAGTAFLMASIRHLFVLRVV